MDDVLQKEILELKLENVQLKRRIDRYYSSPILLRFLIDCDLAELLNANIDISNNNADLVTKKGERIEVKQSSIRNKKSKSKTFRWNWERPFGISGKKRYHYLLLLGENSNEYKSKYKGRDQVYIYFLIPYDDVEQFVEYKEKQKRFHIEILINKNCSKKTIHKLKFYEFEVTESELIEKFKSK